MSYMLHIIVIIIIIIIIIIKWLSLGSVGNRCSHVTGASTFAALRTSWTFLDVSKAS